MIGPELDAASIAAILAMTAATYLTRAAGFWMMGHVPITARVRRMLDALPGCVLIAILAPMVARSGVPGIAAVVVAATLMTLWRNEFLAVLAAIATVAGLRAAGL
jgi:uncharacterized membrane protein